jgi:hypothetical protein
MYESDGDRRNEDLIRRAIEEIVGVFLHKLPTSYGLDYVATGDAAGASLVGWYETKCRSGMTWGQYPDVMVSVLKLRAAAGLRVSTDRPASFAVADNTGEIRVASLCDARPEWIRYGGRTSQTRDSADVEPVCHIPLDRFVPLKDIPRWDR